MNAATHFRHARFDGDGAISIHTSPRPQPEQGEVLVRISRTALCGSDNRLWRTGATQIPGHEIFGVVDQPGHARHGERACIYIPVFCGSCHSCRAGFTQSCETQSVLIGWNRDGGFGECVAVPEQCLLPVPDSIEDRLAPLLLDTIGTTAHATRQASRLLGGLPGRRILVSGAGPIGIGVLIALLDQGCSAVDVFDPVTTRLSFACQLGAAGASAQGTRSYDCIFECSGAHSARDDAIARVAPGGVVILIGENSAPWVIQEGPVFRRKDFCLLRSFYFPVSEHAENIALLQRQCAAYALIADDEFELDELADAYPRFVAGETLKPLLSFAATPVAP